MTEISRKKAGSALRQSRKKCFRASTLLGTLLFAGLLQTSPSGPLSILDSAPALADEPEKASVTYDRQINLVYTINNLGYTDTCG